MNVLAACMGTISSLQLPLFAVEEDYIFSAVNKRRREFRAGRTCARRALGQLGATPMPILVDQDRKPRWPLPYLGSISHSRDMCISIVGYTVDYIGIGVDIEDASPLIDGVAPCVLGPNEQTVNPNGIVEPGVPYGKLIFVIKEAVYKAYYPATLHFLEFLDVEVELDDERSFTAYLRHADCPNIGAKRSIRGFWVAANGSLVAVAIVPQFESTKKRGGFGSKRSGSAVGFGHVGARII